MSQGVRLLVFQLGWSAIYDLVNKDECIVLIPVEISGSANGHLYDSTTERYEPLTYKTNTVYLISGRTSLYVEQGSKVVCVVLRVGRGKMRKDKKGG